jgi:uncharacterized repeat protein (TIGR03803 family)
MRRIVNAFAKLNWGKKACAVLFLCGSTAVALRAQGFTTLHSFDGANGQLPYAGLVQAIDGDFYGTTYEGGANGYGTVFQISPGGTLKTLYSFCAQSGCPDGSNPAVGLVEDTNGNLYGTTFGGTVFKITPSGTLTTIYSFAGYPTDGSLPYGALTQASDGDFYGTTASGGANCAPYGCGTVFKITLSGALTTLHSFDGTDGETPRAGLVQARNGDFYGTTNAGGTNGRGTVFKITHSGTLTTLYSFCSQSGCADGEYPWAELLQAANGSLYGTTQGGGTSGDGTVFKIAPSGALTPLHSFDGPDGDGPFAGLVEATNGDFYGTTYYGGRVGGGTVFKITASGTLTTLHSFEGAHGIAPQAALVQATDGNLYGTTALGGHYGEGYGTVFSLRIGLGPFVKTQPISGRVGALVKILGTNLTGATSVTFNGTAAAFAVNSTGTAISTTVPAGATTGPVQVVTPGGTLSSNEPFRVLP